MVSVITKFYNFIHNTCVFLQLFVTGSTSSLSLAPPSLVRHTAEPLLLDSALLCLLEGGWLVLRGLILTSLVWVRV